MEKPTGSTPAIAGRGQQADVAQLLRRSTFLMRALTARGEQPDLLRVVS